MSQKRLLVLCIAGLLSAVTGRAAKVNIPDGTPVPVRLKVNLSSDRAEVGDRVDFEVAHAVRVGGATVIPEGCVAWGAVQSVKREKEIKFDIQGLRLPDLREIKLRVSRQKTSNPGKDLIKLETRLGDTVGAAPGTEFTAYVNEDVEVESPESPAPLAGKTPPSASRPAEVKTATSMPPAVVSAPATAPASVGTPSATGAASTTPAASPSTTVPVTRPPAPPEPAPSATMAVPRPEPEAERVTVECYSDPTGAEIRINDEYYGNTPSILKLLPAKHRLDLKMPGYTTYSLTLDLTQGGTFRTVRGSLEKKE